MTEPPVLDQLDSRLLESREVIRSFVKKTEVVDAAEAGLLLRTRAERTTAMTRFPEGRDAAEFAVLIKDDYQGQGLGSELVKRLVQAARDEPDIGRVVAYMLPENLGMKTMASSLGFELTYEDRMIKAELSVDSR